MGNKRKRMRRKKRKIERIKDEVTEKEEKN